MKNILITGGAGFVGCNLTDYLLNNNGHKVTVFDNLSRKGTDKNLKWLMNKNKSNFNFINGDIRNFDELQNSVKDADVIYHLAGQVAVTTSVEHPREDFEVNALGTFNMLEAARKSLKNPTVLFTSTNKVYGKMEDVKVIERNNRYEYQDLTEGVSENRNIDFHSPYGCSKGTADQYVRDYARIYDLNTVVFRMSCIYGMRQLGNEDQGWIAHFIISSIFDKPLTIYGDGKQIRDILFVEDLIRGFILATDNIKTTKGKIYNVGGSAKNTISLLELIALIEKKSGKKVSYNLRDWRPGDQEVYVSDVARIKNEIGWEPKTTKEEGINKLFEWVNDNRELFTS